MARTRLFFWGFLIALYPALSLAAEKIPTEQLAKDRMGCVQACSQFKPVEICTKYCNCLIDDIAQFDYPTYQKLNNRTANAALDPTILQKMANSDMRCQSKAGIAATGSARPPAAARATPPAAPGPASTGKAPVGKAPVAKAPATAPVPAAPPPTVAPGGSFSPLLDLRSKDKKDDGYQ